VGMSGSARWLVLPRGFTKGSSIQCCVGAAVNVHSAHHLACGAIMVCRCKALCQLDLIGGVLSVWDVLPEKVTHLQVGVVWMPQLPSTCVCDCWVCGVVLGGVFRLVGWGAVSSGVQACTVCEGHNPASTHPPVQPGGGYRSTCLLTTRKQGIAYQDWILAARDRCYPLQPCQLPCG
jgi:hypothetical protein